MEFSISKTWDSKPVDHDAVTITLHSDKDDIIMEMNAPFFNDPPAPNGVPGKPFQKLWEYEVVEAFFLGTNEQYLEVEFSPHGQHLLLLLAGRKNAIKMCLPVNYTASIEGISWYGVARIPKSYFPINVNLFNAYAIHGSGEKREYDALFPVPAGHFTQPDFHRLEFFRYIDFSGIISNGDAVSDVWLEALKEKNEGNILSCDQE